MGDWIVVIPSYKRVAVLKSKTLAVLKKYEIPKEKIYVFVADTEELAAYTEGVGEDVGHIIVGIRGLVAVRNYIHKYFPKGQRFVSFDDDVTGFIEYVTPKESIVLPSLKETIDRGFAECDKSGAALWGVYPIANAFFMKPKVSYDFKFVIGSFWGCINPGDEIVINIGSGEKEDYQRCILFWIRDKKIVRINNVALKTATYKTPGGLNDGARLERERATVKAMMELWGGTYIRLNPKRKSRYPELSLIKQKTSNVIAEGPLESFRGRKTFE
jgi:hypothetical protein